MRECFIYEFDHYSRQESERVRESGGSIASSANDLIAIFLIHQVQIDGEDFIVAGAFAEGCVAQLIDYLLLLEASSVTVDVSRCRSVYEVIDGNVSLTIAKRTELIKASLKPESRQLEGTRLLFVSPG